MTTRLHKVLVFVFFVIGLAGLVAVAYGLPMGGGDVAYFDDDTYTNQVGEWVWYDGCSAGNSWHWGVQTGYYQAETWTCGGYTGSCTYRSYGYYDTDEHNDPVWVDLGSSIQCTGGEPPPPPEE